MYYLGSISGSSGAAYNWSGGASGLANFPIPQGPRAFYFVPSASGLRFALSAATGYTGFLGTGAGLGTVQLVGPDQLNGPFQVGSLNSAVGIYNSSATQYSVRVFTAPRS